MAKQSYTKPKRFSYENTPRKIRVEFKTKRTIKMGTESLWQEGRIDRSQGSDERNKGQPNPFILVKGQTGKSRK